MQPSDGSEAVIRLRGLTKRFGSLTAVDRLHLDVEAGEVFGFLRPNGAGKSTTIGMMLGLIRPTAGSVEMFGLDANVGTVDRGRAYRRILRRNFRRHDLAVQQTGYYRWRSVVGAVH